EKPEGGGTWTDFVVNTCNGKLADGGATPHGHHIVMKGTRFTANAKARQILCKYKINPYKGCANLVISPNKCHSESYTNRVLMELQSVDKDGASATEIAQALARMAVVHRNCPGGGKVDPAKDDDPLPGT